MQLVKKANDLIEAKYSLTKNEQRIVLYLVSKVRVTDKDFKTYEFSFDEISKLTEISKTRVYVELNDIAESLLKKPIRFAQGSKVATCNWCSWFETDKKNFLCKIRFDPGLKPYLLQLKKYFTAYDMKYVTGFESKYSFRIYELCKQYESLKERKISVPEIKSFLKIENKYSRFADLRIKVILPSLKDINKHSDIYVEVDYFKVRRSVKEVIFKISSKEIKKQSSDIEQFKTLENSLHDVSLLEKNANKISSARKEWEVMSDKEKDKYNKNHSIGFFKFIAEF